MNNKFQFVLLLALFFAFGPEAPAAGEKELKLSTVVIDAGHGGKDAGCISKDRKTYEKHLTLAIAKLLGQKINEAYPDIKVIYTRTTDKYLTLNERADVANRNKANLFISIHINAVAQTSANGFSVFILGKSNKKGTDMFSTNMDVCRRENSVILLEEDYTTKYQGFDPSNPESFIFFNLMQNAHFEQSLLFASEIDGKFSKGPFRHNRGIYQDAFYVLWKTTMPAVLVEAGFISNADDLRVMKSQTGKEQIAERLFDAFKSFKIKYDSSIDYSAGASSQAGTNTDGGDSASSPSGPSSVSEDAGQGVRYGVQVLLLSRRLKDNDNALKGYVPQVFKTGNLYKYIIGVDDDESKVREMHKSLKKDFPDSFIVKIEDGKVSRM